MSEIKRIIQGSIDQDPIGVQQAFVDAIAGKIRDIVSERKAEVAQRFIGVDQQDYDYDDSDADDYEDEIDNDSEDVDDYSDDYEDDDDQLPEEFDELIDQMIDEGFSDDEIDQALEELIAELYEPKSPDEKRFMQKHVAIKHKDANGNGDELFKGSNIKTIDRTKDHHGYNPGEDEKVYEDVEELDESENPNHTMEIFRMIHNDAINGNPDAIKAIHHIKKYPYGNLANTTPELHHVFELFKKYGHDKNHGPILNNWRNMRNELESRQNSNLQTNSVEYDDEEILAERAKLSPKQQAKIAKVMREYGNGTLKDSHGKKVTSREQAAAIAYSEAGVGKR